MKFAVFTRPQTSVKVTVKVCLVSSVAMALALRVKGALQLGTGMSSCVQAVLPIPLKVQLSLIKLPVCDSSSSKETFLRSGKGILTFHELP